MLRNHQIRPTTTLLLSGALFALSFGPAAQVASALVVTGQGFGSNNNMFINVTDSSGTEWDTDSRAFSCNETENWVVVIYQNYGLGCSSGARPGPLNRSNSDSTFSGVVQIPSSASVGAAQLCAKGVFATTCTPIMISAPSGQ